MSKLFRLRQHADGQLAIEYKPGWWVTIHLDPDSVGMRDVSAEYVSGEEWTELFIAELPKPDGMVDCVDSKGDDDTRTPTWHTSWGESVTAWIEGIETPCWDLTEGFTPRR